MEQTTTVSHAARQGVARSEIALWVGALTAAVFLAFGDDWLADLSDGLKFSLLFSWLFAVMLWLAFSVVRHADCLAVRLGEPYGTMILTVSVISIEVVVIAAVMVTGENVPTLARDTIFSVLMIVINGLLGVTLLIGGLKHHEQYYNTQGASVYLGVLIPIAGLGMVLPRYMTSAPGGEASPLMAGFMLLTSVFLYAAFLWIQTTRHQAYFKQPELEIAGDPDAGGDHHGFVIRSVSFHALFLVLCMLPIVLLSKKMAVLVDHGIAILGAPQALGGFLVATLVLTPEAMAAIKSAWANRLQRTINISLGSGVATIGLTIPAVLAVSFITGRKVELGLEAAESYLLLLTMICAVHNLAGSRTNVMHGFVHLGLFLAYIVLIFD
jgi:Ca2+:H+ antiporter